MSDPLNAGAGGLDIEGLVSRIQSAPPKVWARLRNGLGVREREEAVNLVRQDPQAARVAFTILGVEEAAPVPPMASPEVLPESAAVPKGGRARLKIG